MEERDGHLFAEMSKRRHSVMPLTWRIVPPRHPSAQEKAMGDAATEWFSDLPEFETLLFNLLNAIGHGFAAVEIGWKQAENIWLPCAFYKRPQRWFQTATHNRNAIRLIDGSLDGAGLNPFGWLAASSPGQKRLGGGKRPVPGTGMDLSVQEYCRP
ncbi:MAG: phage portal protein family protein [Sodalis sp. (in: enterobacteria)]|uniref:phage portal protein family protein n=1 Tax=Sodalis sp. (in: enterobacteria) TaxID=1898979 RepID=UPI003F2C346D